MDRQYYTHWILGIICSIIWFWGDKLNIPPAAISLASSVVPALVGHAIAFTPNVTDQPSQVGLSQSSTEGK